MSNIGSLLNYSLEVMNSDASKKLVGYYPDVHLSGAQKSKQAVKDFLRKLDAHVTRTFVRGIADLYDAGGYPFTDSQGVEWQFVPVLAFVAADMEEARYIKGLKQAWNMRMPCHLCVCPFVNADKIVEPRDMEYRDGDELAELVREYEECKRYAPPRALLRTITRCNARNGCVPVRT